MRKRFEQQLSLGITPISEVEIRIKSRDEMPPLLIALQTIFTTKALNEVVFELLEEAICKDKKATGRQGMDLWHILVLALVRHACNTNWDKLHRYANTDMEMRSVMGLRNNTFEEGFYEFEYQTILDNVSLLDVATINKINLLVVEYGLNLFKKKENEALILKTDSFVVETNIHFPTDLNLLNDSVRKGLNRIIVLIAQKEISSEGWRKIKSTIKGFKVLLRSTSWAVFKGKKDEYKKEMVKLYLSAAKEIEAKLKAALALCKDEELEKYTNYVSLFINQIDRRLLKNETIPTEEKVYSIFEEHTEWISKGKRHAELGNLMMITTNQNHLIMDYKIMFKEKDAAQVKPLLDRLQVNYPTQSISSISTDKGFWSASNYESCVQAGIENVVMPKKGKCNKKEYAREHDETFIKLRNKHSAVESNINMLEHHGLNRCMDKGQPHFERFVAVSVLAYNLHLVGKEIIKQQQEKEKKAFFKKLKKNRHKQAA
jgi:transposase, IS5 family